MRFALLPFLFLAATATADEPRWFKGNTHTHSLWSDGNDFPEMISAWYKDQGYDFLCMSDHNTLAEGDKWVAESTIEKKKITLGRKVVEKCTERFGPDWLVTRPAEKGGVEVKLKTLEEYRGKLEVPGKFLLVQAEEVSAGFAKSPIHINAINLTEAIQPVKDLVSIRETMRTNLQAIAAQGMKKGKPIMSHLNHPNFRWAVSAEDIAHVIEDKFFEVYNGHPSTYPEGDPARADTSTDRIWDIANTIRLVELKAAPLYALGTDDSHHYHGGTATSGRGWIMVKADKLDGDALVEAMHRGDFYASCGVKLKDVTFDKTTRKLTVKIQGEPGVKYTTEFRGTPKNYNRAVQEVPAPADDNYPVRLKHSEDVGKLLASSQSLESSYQMTGDELYVRAIIISDQVMKNPATPGQLQKAWTQPVGWQP